MTEKKKNIINPEHSSTGLTRLGEGMSPLIKKLLGGSGLVQVELFAEWKNIVGEETSSYSAPQKIDFKKDSRNGGILHIAVPDGAFALEISAQKNILLEKVNSYFGYQAISDIRLTINDVFFKQPEETPKDDDKQEKMLVSLQQQNYISKLTEDIKNPELKATLQKLGESIAKNNK